MKRIALLVLTAAMAIDVTQQAYNSNLLDAIAQRPSGQSVVRVVVQSPVMTTIEHWLFFFIGFGLLSLLMARRKPQVGPDILG
ncbi:hypothetical protein FHS31_002508 [Sphingomonas vulcanisoli]|uniref:IPTL-CTERM sorting domain-containing protein n=1 Tax=Sphingomonas vulcanisoli TaxID=1658060 RepID=A0ABX0TXI8_9SPHN|nr:hypothetical protein [Sphingomonas vulcanisoli]NIJ08884.1 hypothetical protein [Sphingomonas vulcanisoli]